MPTFDSSRFKCVARNKKKQKTSFDEIVLT